MVSQCRLDVRVRSGIERRLRYAWRWLKGELREFQAAHACRWLVQQPSATGGGLPLLAGEGKGDCGLTAAALPVLAACGQRQLVYELVCWLLNQQTHDGAFTDAAGQPCRIATGQAIRGMLEILPGWHRAPRDERFTRSVRATTEQAITRAGHFLAAGDCSAARGSLIDWASPAIELVPLAALLQAAERFDEPRWEQTGRDAAQQFRRTHDLARWDTPLHFFASTVRAMLDLGWVKDAEQALQLAAALQGKAGNVPALPHVHWVSSSGLAQLAVCWYRLGQSARADAALAAVYRHQQSDGGFAGSWGAGAAYHPQRQSIATACFVLEAALAQVASSFQRCRHSEDAFSPEDGRLLAVRDALAKLPSGSHVADIGCGAGRYLRWLQPWFPDHRWIGIDASPEALKRLPRGIERRQGSLLHLPAIDAEFDAVFCVEALEHALLPEQAIAELCRVTRPGGRLLVIDKHRRFQPLSHHEPWEIWFAPEEVRRWLEPFCEEVFCQPIAQMPHPKAGGLFLSWEARRGRGCIGQRLSDAA